MEEPGVRYALAPDGSVADPKTAPPLEHAYRCFACGEHVHLRKGRVRKAHFAHYAKRPRPCSSETVAHEAAKHKLVSLLLGGARSLELRLACRGHTDVFSDAQTCPDGAQLERSLPIPDFDWADVEVTFGSYRLDAAASSAGRVVLGLEVYQSRLVDPAKRAALTAAGLPWAELPAEEVLEKSTPWAVVTSSLGAQQCVGCTGREASARAERARRESAERTARANAEALQQRQNGQVQAPTASGGESVDRVRYKANKLGRNRRQIEKAACFARSYLAEHYIDLETAKAFGVIVRPCESCREQVAILHLYNLQAIPGGLEHVLGFAPNRLGPVMHNFCGHCSGRLSNAHEQAVERHRIIYLLPEDLA